MTTQRRWDPDEVAGLEHERDILLRELTELDEQLRCGEIDSRQHESLSDELTGRAAATLTALESGRSLAPTRQRSLAKTLGVVAGLCCAAVLLGWVLMGQVAPRDPAVTAGPDVAAPEERAGRLEKVVTERPDDVPARMAYARLLIEQQKLPEALVQYDAAVEDDPDNVEALAYGGWVAVLTKSDGGLDRLDRAIAADPSYPDAHALRGLGLMQSGSKAEALVELQRYLELDPSGPLAGQVQQLIDRLAGGR